MRMTIRARLLNEEGGATAVTVALALVALLGMVVLVVDLGALLVARRRVVNAADAAALAAAESCALGHGSSEADAQADLLATQNYEDATRTVFAFSPACGAGNGSVHVGYQADQELFFAPLLGFHRHGSVGATATATWGAAGSGRPIPIEVSLPWLTQHCGIPGPVQGGECDFWYDENDLGGSQWGFINLDIWNVAGDGQCHNAGTAKRGDWIANSYPTELLLNGSPPGTGRTFTCADSGHSSRDWMDLHDQIGTVKLFPVNDPTGQVGRDGALAPPPASPDKYDIVGFTALYVADVLKGNDPVASGVPGASGDCSATASFDTRPPANTFDLASTGCDTTGMSDLTLSKRVGADTVTYVDGTDYSFDAASNVVTWLRPQAEQKVHVEWSWATGGTPGKCGLHAPDANAICLVTQWRGFLTGGSVEGGGPDLGARYVRLSE